MEILYPHPGLPRHPPLQIHPLPPLLPLLLPPLLYPDGAFDYSLLLNTPLCSSLCSSLSYSLLYPYLVLSSNLQPFFSPTGGLIWTGSAYVPYPNLQPFFSPTSALIWTGSAYLLLNLARYHSLPLFATLYYF